MKHTSIGYLSRISLGRVWLIYGLGHWTYRSRSIWVWPVRLHISTTSRPFFGPPHTFAFVKVRLTRLRSMLVVIYLPWGSRREQLEEALLKIIR